MFCKYCGFNIDDDSVFCNKCGGKQTKSESAPPSPMPATVVNSELTAAPVNAPAARMTRKKLITIIACAVLLIAATITTITVVLSMPNTKITLENYNKIQENVTTYNEVCEIFGEQGKPFNASTEPSTTSIYTWQYIHKSGTRTVAISFENNIVITKAKTGF